MDHFLQSLVPCKNNRLEVIVGQFLLLVLGGWGLTVLLGILRCEKTWRIIVGGFGCVGLSCTGMIDGYVEMIHDLGCVLCWLLSSIVVTVIIFSNSFMVCFAEIVVIDGTLNDTLIVLYLLKLDYMMDQYLIQFFIAELIKLGVLAFLILNNLCKIKFGDFFEHFLPFQGQDSCGAWCWCNIVWRWVVSLLIVWIFISTFESIWALRCERIEWHLARHCKSSGCLTILAKSYIASVHTVVFTELRRLRYFSALKTGCVFVSYLRILETWDLDLAGIKFELIKLGIFRAFKSVLAVYVERWHLRLDSRSWDLDCGATQKIWALWWWLHGIRLTWLRFWLIGNDTFRQRCSMVYEHLSFLWVANIRIWMVVLLHIASGLLRGWISLCWRFLSICTRWVLVGIWKLHFTVRLVKVSTRFRLLLAYERKQEVVCVIRGLTQILLLQIQTFNLLALTSLIYIIFINHLWWYLSLIHWFP